jgi:transmembrane sensor
LLEGQALFDVAKDHKRPFIVASGAAEVRAVGTLFDVYRKRSGTTVTVVEGRVAVHSKQAERQHRPAHEVERAVLDSRGDSSTSHTAAEHASDQNGRDILLGAGEQLVVTQTTIDKQASPDIAAATAWRQRQLIFSATPLTEVAEEFNRYNSRQLVVLSPSLASFNVSAVFSATDQASLLRFLRAQPNIRLEESDKEVRIIIHPG